MLTSRLSLHVAVLAFPVETGPHQAASVLAMGLGLRVLFQSRIAVLMSFF